MTNWLARLRDVCGKATQGKWVSKIHGDGKYFPHAYAYQIPNEATSFPLLQPTGPEPGSVAFKSNKENSHYIATFNPQAIAAMLDVVEAAQRHINLQVKYDGSSSWVGENSETQFKMAIALAALKKLAGGEDE